MTRKIVHVNYEVLFEEFARFNTLPKMFDHINSADRHPIYRNVRNSFIVMPANNIVNACDLPRRVSKYCAKLFLSEPQ